jgi:hypothetical protein
MITKPTINRATMFVTCEFVITAQRAQGIERNKIDYTEHESKQVVIENRVPIISLRLLERA